MPEIGPMEVLLVAIVALIVFGPEKLPQLARNVGRAANEVRRMATEAKDEFTSGFDDEDEGLDQAEDGAVEEDRDHVAARPEGADKAGEEQPGEPKS
jgi:Tat protein translocase TatB subunit